MDIQTNNLKNSKLTPKIILICISLITVFIWFIPFGSYLLYPFTIFGTWVHEMSHGITALILGGSFHKLEIYPNGSGIAFFSINSNFFYQISKGIIAAAGPMGPAIVGSLAIRFSKNPKSSSRFLTFITFVMIVSLVFWVRPVISLSFGMIILFAIVTSLLSRTKNNQINTAYLQLLGLQCFSAMLLSIDYLFTDYISSAQNLSDTKIISESFLLPHWFWAIVIIIASIILFFKSIKTIIRN